MLASSRQPIWRTSPPTRSIDDARRAHLATRRPADPRRARRIRLGELDRGGELDVENSRSCATSASNSRAISWSSPARPFLGEEPDEAADELVGVAEHLFKESSFCARVQLGALEHRPELLDLVDRGDEVGQLLVHALEPSLILRGLEERAYVRCATATLRVLALVVLLRPRSRGRRSLRR